MPGGDAVGGVESFWLSVESRQLVTRPKSIGRFRGLEVADFYERFSAASGPPSRHTSAQVEACRSDSVGSGLENRSDRLRPLRLR